MLEFVCVKFVGKRDKRHRAYLQKKEKIRFVITQRESIARKVIKPLARALTAGRGA